MNTRTNTDCACREISGDLADLLGWLSDEATSPEQFRQTVVTMEARKMQRFGFRLASCVGEEGSVRFSLRLADNDELCASIDVDPKSGAMQVQVACVRG